MQDFFKWVHNLRPSLFNTLNYDEIFVIDTSEQESVESDVNTNSSEKRHPSSYESLSNHSQEQKKEMKDNQAQIGEGLVDNEQDYTC